MANKGKRMVFEDEYNYLQELIENHNDPSAEWGSEGKTYTAGDGIDISAQDVISIDSTVALKSELFSGDYNDLTNKPTIPDAVSGTNDGTNWTTLTIGSDTYGIGGGSAPSNMVTTDTTQTITAEKTFSYGLGTKWKTSNVDGYVSIKPENIYITNENTTNPENLYIYDNRIAYISDQSNIHNFKIYLHDNNMTNVGKYTFRPNKTGDVAITSELPKFTVIQASEITGRYITNTRYEYLASTKQTLYYDNSVSGDPRVYNFKNYTQTAGGVTTYVFESDKIDSTADIVLTITVKDNGTSAVEAERYEILYNKTTVDRTYCAQINNTVVVASNGKITLPTEQFTLYYSDNTSKTVYVVIEPTA